MTSNHRQDSIDPAATDRPLLDIIRRRGPITVLDLAAALAVTPTAVRNRLSRLVSAGLVDRRTESGGRGRPPHLYLASAEAHRRLGQNYTDLAVVLWEELMRTVEDRKLRRFLFTRITDRLAELYRSEVRGESWEARLVELGTILHDRGVETEVAHRDGKPAPVLELLSCPYFELAGIDRAICALERKMFEKILGEPLRLSQCRLGGHRSCDFEQKPVPGPLGPAARAS